MSATPDLLTGARAPQPSNSTPTPRARDRRVRPDEDGREGDAVDPSGAASADTIMASAVEAVTAPGDVVVSDVAPDAAVGASEAQSAATPPEGDKHDDRYAPLLAAGVGLLGIGGAASLAGSSSGSAPPIAAVEPPKPEQPRQDPPVSGQKPDAGSGPDHPGVDLPPPPDQSKPDQPRPDPSQQPDPGKSDPDPARPTDPDPDPKPPAHVPAAPVLSLTADTGSSDHDRITSSGSVNVSGLEAGATLAFSLDGGKTWTPRSGDALLPEALFGADGEKHLTVKQIDASGNEGVASALSFLLDRTAPGALHWTAPADKSTFGASDSIVPLGVEAGARVEYRFDATSDWQTAADGRVPLSAVRQGGPTPVEVRQVDLAGNAGTATTLNVDMDVTAPAAPTVSLLKDTGVSNTDGITSSGDFRVSGLEQDARLLVSLDGGSSWKEIPADSTALDELGQSKNYGLVGLSFKQADEAGNVSDATTLNFTLDRAARTPFWTSSNPDHAADATALNGHDTFKVLRNAGSTLDSADKLSYRIDGGDWVPLPDDGQVPLSRFGADGQHQLELRQTDLAGNDGLTKVAVTLDATPPAAPTLALFHDDGWSATDHVTTDGRVVISGPDLLGLDFQSRVNGGGWVDERLGDGSPRNYSNGPGVIDLEVRFIDAAGNVGPSSALHYKVVHPGDDVPPPAVPVLSFVGPTVVNQDGLRVSATPDLKVSGLESSNARFYSLDQGSSWKAFSGDTLPSTIFGSSSNGHEDQNVQVKQVDRAGNEALSAPLHFIFDNFTPALSWRAPFQIGPDGASAVYGPDGKPLRKSVLGSEDTLSIYGIEREAHQEFSLDGGAHWSSFSGSVVPVKDLFNGRPDGDYTLMLRQTDLVGNVGAAASQAISVDVHAPAQPTLALRNDDGSSATDRVTSDGTFVITGQESGSTVQFSFRGESMWHDAGTMTGQEFILRDYNPDDLHGFMTMAVRLVDAVGNISASTSLSFTLVHSQM